MFYFIKDKQDKNKSLTLDTRECSKEIKRNSISCLTGTELIINIDIYQFLADVGTVQLTRMSTAYRF